MLRRIGDDRQRLGSEVTAQPVLDLQKLDTVPADFYLLVYATEMIEPSPPP